MSKESILLPYQIRYLNDHSRVKIVEKSRRIGGTYMQAYEDVEDIVAKREYTPGRPVKRVYFSSKDAEAGKDYIEYCGHWAKLFNVAASKPTEEVIDEETGVLATVIKFKDDCRIYSLTSAPTAFNSKGGKIVWDEAALHKAQQAMWSGAQPAALWGYPIRILSTHKGTKTLFYRFVTNTRAGKTGWSLHRIPIQLAVAEGLYDKICGRLTTEQERREWLDQARRDAIIESIWQEDYCCNPQDSTTAWITYEDLAACEKVNLIVKLENLAKLGDLYLGWDVARTSDLSVIHIAEKIGPLKVTRFIKRFENATFREQKHFFSQVMALPNLRRACIDESGIGKQLAEEARDQYGQYRVEPVNFSNSTKEDLAIGARQAVQDREAWVPAEDDTFRESVHNICKDKTASGNVRFDADRTDETGHGDDFWAWALAIHAAGKPTGTPWALTAPAGAIISAYNDFAEPLDLRHY